MESTEVSGRTSWLSLQEFLIFLTVFLLVTLAIRGRRNSNLPPGPSAWSFLGNIFHPDQPVPQVVTAELSRKYGNIYTTHILWIPVIILNGFQTIQEALIQHGREFAGRPHLHITDLLSKGQGILTAQYDRSWKQQRRFALTVLRNFGLGQFTFEDSILEEAHYLAAAFGESEGSSFDPQAIITSAVSNVTCKVIFGKRFHYQDRKFMKLVALFDEALKLQGGFWAMVCAAVPNIHRFPGPHQRIFENKVQIEAILQDFIQQHKDSLDAERIRDFIDAYLLEMEKERNFPGSCLTDGNLLYNIYDLFLAGTETTTTTLCWALLYMMAYPDVQVLLEESQWKHPNQFNPENFLNENGEFFKPDAFIPFSMGLRACLGEKLAKIELFLFFTTMLQNFEFHWPDKTSPPDLKGSFKIIMAPRPYKLELRSRMVHYNGL
ncbi:hypothetical protein chiPu_0018125 [Chiloscyllium punctatum]|uniref:Cytochrome P450 n=1 Tax=Chiloscyllium punctatum TaxID=137246 RepID=A0A401RL69_CHIPU|nr:hypothetical protein [Chiloscyllium punctatum]